jgi:DNA-binding HxlR family transcriptional regulator
VVTFGLVKLQTMANSTGNQVKHNEKECQRVMNAVGDALYVIGGKWKLPIIAALSERNNQRFNELQRAVKGISARVLSNELKQLEMNGFIKRNIYTQSPVIVEYELTEYSKTLEEVLTALHKWGSMHRNKILGKGVGALAESIPAELEAANY